ncbi:hypothetical protein ACSBLW_08580 [Thioclava sp. FR2]|uniref:hypothetical protein n=1 Tax=Thioclava sp. FR2 TaxID=3445780 RepID=UPI003EC0B2C8
MNRRDFTLMALATLCVGTPALAASYQDQIVSQLKKQGYGNIRVQRTLLGRVRIVASGSGGQREIILNPRTGEILRDFWTATGSSSSSGGKIIESGGSGGSGGSSDDDDDGDDGDDNSGHGGGSDDDDDDDDDDNSGSGSSGSGGGDDDGGDDD